VVKIHDRSDKVRRRKTRMPVSGRAMKNPEMLKALLSGRRKKTKTTKKR
jgi:hypothetical protein